MSEPLTNDQKIELMHLAASTDFIDASSDEDRYKKMVDLMAHEAQSDSTETS